MLNHQIHPDNVRQPLPVVVRNSSWSTGLFSEMRESIMRAMFKNVMLNSFITNLEVGTNLVTAGTFPAWPVFVRSRWAEIRIYDFRKKRERGERKEEGGRREHCINPERTERIPAIDSRYNFGAGRKIDRPKNLHGVRRENTCENVATCSGFKSFW